AHNARNAAAALTAARLAGADLAQATAALADFGGAGRRFERLGLTAAGALVLADVVVVLGIYPARERQEDFPGVTGRLVAAAAADAAGGRPVAWLPGFDEAEAF